VGVQELRAVRVQAVTLTRQREAITFSGTVTPRTMVDLAFRIPGKVIARPVNVSDRVSRDQILLQLDPADLRHQVAHDEAGVIAAEAEANNAKSMFLRYEKMGHGSSAFVESEYDTRLSAMRAAEARLQQARRQLDMASDQHGYADLKADAEGVITALPVEAGQVVAAGQTVATLAHTSETEITVDVPETRLAEIRDAEDVIIALWAVPGQAIHGHVREIGALANAATRTFAVKISIPDPGQVPLVLGVTATARFVGAPGPSRVILPAGTLTAARGQAAVWTLNETAHRAILTPVHVTAYGSDGTVEIGEGLTSGQLVITAGADLLDADMPVTAWRGPTR
jgi:multidrug efflux system membrane fusion protein